MFTTTINWGDAVDVVPGINPPLDTSTGTVVANGTGFNVLGSHTYATPGTYQITGRSRTPSVTPLPSSTGPS